MAASDYPTLVDIKCMGSSDLLAMARFCVKEHERLANLNTQAARTERSACEQVFGLAEQELCARSIAVPCNYSPPAFCGSCGYNKHEAVDMSGPTERRSLGRSCVGRYEGNAGMRRASIRVRAFG